MAGTLRFGIELFCCDTLHKFSPVCLYYSLVSLQASLGEYNVENYTESNVINLIHIVRFTALTQIIIELHQACTLSSCIKSVKIDQT